MTYKIPAIIGAAGLLASCDMAMEQVGNQVRGTVVEQCKSVSEGMGIAGDQIAPICECTADTFMQKNAEEISQVDRARVQEIVLACVADTGAATPDSEAETPIG
ncbi:MAG: hypothetical protein WA954_04025 [Parerythrobacter sp.]